MNIEGSGRVMPTLINFLQFDSIHLVDDEYTLINCEQLSEIHSSTFILS